MKRKLICIAALVLVFSIMSSQALAAASDNKGFKDAKQAEEFADNLIKTAMDKYHVPGVALVVVKDGKVFFKKGYGYADMDKRILVDPDRTVFRVGSVSKPFAATAVMQLVEQGKIDLNEDVNKYLKEIKIKSKYSKPVTMDNLLTHTAGFDEELIGIQQKDLKEPVHLGEYLKDNIPSIIRKPGTITQYSNHGMALAGYIVEEVAGIPFERYVEDNILTPLDMKYSSFTITKDIETNMAIGYSYSKEKFVPIKPYNINLSPAGGLCTTAGDMSKFLIAHLQNGKYNDRSILKEDTAVNMHRKHFTNYQGMPGSTYGFYESIRNGIKVIEHGGAIHPFMSMLSMLPEENVGFFISTNGPGGAELNDEFANEFYKFFTAEDQAVPTFVENNDFKTGIKDFEGTYTSTRRPKTNLLKFISLLSEGQNLIIKPDGEGKLAVTSKKGTKNYIRKADSLFMNDEDGTYIAFKNDENGIYMTESTNAINSYEKLKWHENRTLHITFLIFYTVIFLTGCLLLLFLILRKKRNSNKGMPGLGLFISNLTCFLNMIFLIGLFTYFMGNQFLYVTVFLKFVMFIPIVSTALTLAMVYFAVASWKRGYWKTAGRIYYTIVTLASAGFVIFMSYSNLIGFKY